MKAVGDPLRPDDIVAEVETDKATMEVVAGAEGVLARIIVPNGTPDVPVRQVIGLITTENETMVATPAAPLSFAIESTSKQASFELIALSSAAVQASVKPIPANGATAGRIFASPIARRLMAEAKLDAAGIVGTGPHGRIVERDVKASIAAAASAVILPARIPAAEAPASDFAASSVRHPSQSSVDALHALFPPGSFEEVPHDSMRLTVSRRLVEAKQTIPHFYLSADCKMDALLALRRQLNEAAPSGAEGEPLYRLSINDFIIKALALALTLVPDANVSFTDRSMLRHRHADISVAVAIPDGLITPIIRRVETKGMSTIAREMVDLASRAKNWKLKPEEYQGGTAGLSNLGMYGVSSFSAIINPPQATILAVGAAEQRLVAREGVATTATMMTVTLSSDHRAVDGATAARLLSAFKMAIENPMTLLV